jgi:hypothetical protein
LHKAYRGTLPHSAKTSSTVKFKYDIHTIQRSNWWQIHQTLAYTWKRRFSLERCKYVDRSQWDYFIEGLWIFFKSFLLFHMKEFLNEIFYNLLLKIYIVGPIDHMPFPSSNYLSNHCWINMKISKCVICQILSIILKIYHNFESYQNMLTNLGFYFLYHKI